MYLIENSVIGNLWFNASSLTLQQQVIDQTVLQTKGTTRSQNGKANHFKVLVQQVRVKESGCKERSFFIKDNGPSCDLPAGAHFLGFRILCP